MAKKVSIQENKITVLETSNLYPQKDFYTLEYIEKTWDLKVRFLREKIKDGSLIGKKVGVSYYVLHSDLLIFIENSKRE